MDLSKTRAANWYSRAKSAVSEYKMRRELADRITSNIPSTTYKKESKDTARKMVMDRDYKGAEKYTKNQLQQGGGVYAQEKLKKIKNW